MDEMLKDVRFAHVAKDPKFRSIPKAERKVKIDKRFKDMFRNKKFTVKYTVDKRGRPVNQTTTEDLRKYYDLSSSDENVSDEDVAVSSLSKETDKKKEMTKTKCKRINDNKKTTKVVGLNSIKHTSNHENASDEDEPASSPNRKTDEKKMEKTKRKKIKDKKKAMKEVRFDFVEDTSNNEDKSEKHNNKYCQSNKNLQKRPQKKDDGSDDKFDISQLNLDENEKQLFIKRKNEDDKLTDKVKDKLKDLSINYARGEGTLLSDSSSEGELSETIDDEEIVHDWGELDKDAETTDKITNRLAICDMDWDRIRAVDLMILLNSFLPNSGVVRSVMIYPSEFGLQRMKEEEINGPKELQNDDIHNICNDDIRNDDICNDDDNEDENEEGASYHMEKLRQYQLNRLKYYYAVAEFDSAETANKVYTDCDGIEYESTSTRLDLRFIPDDMTFDQEPKETCNEIPEPTKYQPRQFVTTALQQVKVNLTWDETNPDRQEFAQKLNSGYLQDIDENVLQTYLASGSDADSEEEQEAEEKKDVTNEVDNNIDSKTNNDMIGKYRSLLKSIEKEEETAKKKDVEMEFTWGINTKEKVGERGKSNEELTPFEQYVEKRKMKKKTKREEKMLKDKNQIGDSGDLIQPDLDTNDKDEKNFKNGKLLPNRQKKNNRNKLGSSSEQEENRQKAELELLMMDQDNDDDRKHFNMKEIEENATLSKSKRKRINKKKNVQEKSKEDDFKLDVKDPRFSALFTSHNFNIDPADRHYWKTKGTGALINEKLKRKIDKEAHIEDKEQSKKLKTAEKLSAELQALIKSVKKKARV